MPLAAATEAPVARHWRLRIAWKVMLVAYLGLFMVSVAIMRRGIDLNTSVGRHLLAGALANAGLVLMGVLLTVNAYQRGERWAWVANLAAFYGAPVMFVDARRFGFMSETVLPQIIGMSLLVLGLALPVDLFWSRRRK